MTLQPGSTLHELRSAALVVAADERVGVVDGRAVHGEPADGSHTPVPGMPIP